jgi:hypothetical protein
MARSKDTKIFWTNRRYKNLSDPKDIENLLDPKEYTKTFWIQKIRKPLGSKIKRYEIILERKRDEPNEYRPKANKKRQKTIVRYVHGYHRSFQFHDDDGDDGGIGMDNDVLEVQ